MIPKVHRPLAEQIIKNLILVFNQGLMADKVVTGSLKSNPKWGARDRNFIAENTYEIIRWWRLLKYCAEIDQRKLTEEIYFWKLCGAWLILKGYELPSWEEFAGLDPAAVRNKKQEAGQVRKIRESVPDWLDETGEREVPDWEQELHAMNEEASVFLRVNSTRIETAALIQELESEGVNVEKVPGLLYALKLTARKNLNGLSSFKKGYFEVQDAGSQLIAEFVKPLPGECIIDACAGAGGKSLYMAQLMNNEGSILATDIYSRKLDELKKRAKRNGTKIIEVIENKQFNSSKFDSLADKILLDVPCSGSGVIKRNPDTKWKLKPRFLEEIKQTQQAILDKNVRFLKPGGEIIYATCSLFTSENEAQVEAFLRRYPHFELLEERRVSPARSGFDGYYMARLKNRP